MAKAINTKINTGVLTFTFTDSDGDVFASFKMNPTDVRIADRAEKVGQKLQALAADAEHGSKNPAEYEEALENAFDEVLGYPASATLFGLVPATTILPDGDIFAVSVLDTIAQAVGPEIQKRAKKMQDAMSRRTAKYHK